MRKSAHPEEPARVIEFPSRRIAPVGPDRERTAEEARPTNLPASRAALIGRDDDIAAVRELVQAADGRLVTLAGAGGSGKTALALDVARGLVDEFADGVWLVELASLSDPALVAALVAASFGMQDEPGRPIAESLTSYLRTHSLLLVLDNCEHLVDACAALAGHLLTRCPELRILATSREPLRIAGEATWQLAPLAVPDPERLRPANELADVPAVRLFVERARAVRSDFVLTPEDAPAVARICVQLDGLPLALELAAARMRVLSVDQIAARLEGSVHLLTGGSRTAPSRQHTLEATLDWSHALLTEPERVLFRRLAVFRGGWDLESAEAVCAGDGVGRVNVLDVLEQLVDKSLAVAEAGAAGARARYRLLEPIRAYASQRLQESGEGDATARGHAAHFVALAERAAPELCGPQQVIWFARLERELDNVRAALTWARERDDAETMLRLAGALGWFWYGRGYHVEGRRWLETGLDRADAVPPPLRAGALLTIGALNAGLGDNDRALPSLDKSLALCRDLDDTRGEAWSLHRLAFIAGWRGEHAQARALFAEAIALSRRAEDPWTTAWLLIDHGLVLGYEDDRPAARAFLEEGLALSERVGDRWQASVAQALLGSLARAEGDIARAAARAAEAVRLIRAQGTRGAPTCARWYLPDCLELLAELAVAHRQLERAALLFGAADGVRQLTGAPTHASHRATRDHYLAADRAALGDAAFGEGWAMGQALSPEQAIAYALEAGAPAATDPTPPTGPESAVFGDTLTRRQREVAILVARGHSNRGIAEELVMSEATARTHVDHILTRLDLHSRAQIATWAAEHGLLAPNPA